MQRSETADSRSPLSRSGIRWALFLSGLLLQTGCASFRSDLRGRYVPGAAADARSPGPPAQVLFVFRHFRFSEGMDVVPKLQNVERVRPNGSRPEEGSIELAALGINHFSDLFKDSLTRLRSLGSYDVLVESPDDPAMPDRRERRKQLEAKADRIVELTLTEHSRFVPQFFAGAIAILSLTAIPVWQTFEYSLHTRVLDRDGRTLGSTDRSALLRDWIQLFLIVVYPFHPNERKLEELYLDLFQDTFRQIDAEGLLAPSVPARGA